jgi:D-3-phosphoglycerate dehydrogenase / 2-oxoglutarate reductase
MLVARGNGVVHFGDEVAALPQRKEQSRLTHESTFRAIFFASATSCFYSILVHGCYLGCPPSIDYRKALFSKHSGIAAKESPMPRVLVSDKLEAPGLDLLREAGIELDERTGLTSDALKEAVRAADGLIVRSATKVTADILDNPGRLRAIVRAGVGVDNIDVAAATRKGIVVMNTPGGNTISTAEQTVALMLSLARQVPAGDTSVRAGKFKEGRSKLIGTQLQGKTLGIIGVGNVGGTVARIALGLGMKVLGFDPFLNAEKATRLGIEAVADVDELIPRCDFLTVHTTLNDATRNLIDAPRMAKMKKGARIINCARGGIVNEEALAEALQSGHLAGAALDVFVQEPPPDNNPLLSLSNTVLTPHLGASTHEAQISVALEAAQLLIDFLTKGVVANAVNMAAFDRSEMEELRLYVDMAHRLGLVHAQMCQGAVKKAELIYRGDVARKNTRVLTAAFAAGLLEYRLAESVNIVNAALLARERGIEIVEQTNPRKGDLSTMIRADVTTEKKTYTAAGSLFGNQYLRLVQLGPFYLDTYLDGILLLFTHRDVPGLIGFIGTIFGKHNVNIAQMTVGRQMPGGEAIAVLNLDSLPSEEALAEVRVHPQISSISVVKLPPAGEMPAWFG